jgi:membrane associated rhomboid family serine protease
MEALITQSPVAFGIFLFILFTSIYAFYANQMLLRKLMLHPFSIHRHRKYYTLITSGFIHADWNHLLFNSFTFFFFAFELERIIGHWQFAVVYFGGLLLSDITTISKYKNNTGYYSLGASGAISAVLFSYILFLPQTKIYLFFIPIGIPAYIFAVLYLSYCYVAAKKAQDHINHDAHFWGALAGVVLTVLMMPKVVPHFFQQLLS